MAVFLELGDTLHPTGLHNTTIELVKGSLMGWCHRCTAGHIMAIKIGILIGHLLVRRIMVGMPKLLLLLLLVILWHILWWPIKRRIV